MSEQLLVAHKDYWRSSIKPRGFTEFCEMVETNGKVTGLWEFVQWDPKTGEPNKRLWSSNVVTDNGAQLILQKAINNALPSSPFNNILITNNSASTTLGASIPISQTGLTSINVRSLPAALPANSTLALGYGLAITQNIAGPTGSTSQTTSGSITVPSFNTDGTHSYGVDSAVVPVPQLGDNPTNAALTSNATVANSYYSGNLSSGAFSVGPGAGGAGNRFVTITYTFKTVGNSGVVTTAGNFTDAWLVDVATGAANTANSNLGDYACHEINTPMTCNGTNNLTVTITIKI